jgi:hypothetical protein
VRRRYRLSAPLGSIFNAGHYGVCDQELRQAYECLGQYGFKERRVMLRTGRAHPLVGALARFRERVQALYSLVETQTSQRQAVPLDQWTARMAEVGASQMGVVEAGMANIGSRIE